MEESQLYEIAYVTVSANTREELFAAGRAELDQLFGKGSYDITEVHYTVDNGTVNGEMYATYLGEPI